MTWWNELFKTPARRKTEQDKRRREALTKAKTALRRERRAIAKRQNQSEALKTKAVEHERAGQTQLAKQAVKQFVQVDKEVVARSMALGNMEYTIEQVQVKDNYDDFVRGMQVVATIEELAQDSVDPDEVRSRLSDLAQRNQDIIEPWTEMIGAETAGPSAVSLSAEEESAYSDIVSDAVGHIESSGASGAGESASIDDELQRKMDEALGKE